MDDLSHHLFVVREHSLSRARYGRGRLCDQLPHPGTLRVPQATRWVARKFPPDPFREDGYASRHTAGT